MEQIQVEIPSIFEELSAVMGHITSNLETSARRITRETPDDRLNNLRKAILAIDAPEVQKQPPKQRHMEAWERFTAGLSDSLDKATVRFLCWVPDVATDLRFLAHITRTNHKLSRKSLTGLVHSCHTRWRDLSPEDQALNIIKALLLRHGGSDRKLARWRGNTDAILGARGPRILADTLFAEPVGLAGFLRQWQLDPATPFCQDIVRAASVLCRNHIARLPSDMMLVYFRDLLSWPHWDPVILKKEIGSLILQKPLPEKVRAILERFLLHHQQFGDPRLLVNKVNWVYVPAQARERVIRWLNQEVPFVFNEHVYQQGKGWVWRQRNSVTAPLSFEREEWI